ncbi:MULTISPECIES: DUF1003 domain-containing protein [unclassified Psychrobacter]|uniref:DUF1003 domain-containing protein n=1 Tax=unclassified Psychrobacter TaxID=196806 RepID=UPI000B7EBAF4|nr:MULTISPECIES: DUF1003 domain-containing protein [unclassified Psychrobacter]MDE4453923.1 DUF1003 domain-containing protein [Psychrobacter sp. DAB_AL62B]OXL19194.1 hypothetical protein CAN34_11420 [Psychrobacter sp. DAB_AL32B]
MNKKNGFYPCIACGQNYPIKNLTPIGAVRKAITEEILHDFPECLPKDYICQTDLSKYRMKYVHSSLKSGKGEVTDLESELIKSMQQHELITKNIDTGLDQKWTFGERLADKIATFGGSWSFLICFAIFLAIWIIVNTVVMVARPADPYPFILLNLILSCIAAIQAPVIMMSQNRQETKDRLRSENDYQINLKAELEIQQLHEKLDHLLIHQWDRLTEIQEIQLDLLSEMSKKH